ncbi:hypothetical protein GHNINEIG_01091 [Hydrogenovibrio crunogenus]|uniref:Uncharacterized protein n=1 Tax=Hydrogenovibrio crunogenus TaxID=39765 RepID=A0A4P7NZ00_9GAMM|nr:hypothetical protein [Hydrogenovibrio crunogenus]QBZ83050.1 hypothetical protein GHNINEIG_01091 [Hydrogenovibrio crunogenus]
MKTFFTKLFSPILNIFEKGEEPEHYTPSHRKILLIMGILFSILSVVSVYFGFRTEVMAALFPAILFAGIGIVCVIIALLGSDRAVTNIWQSTRQSR